MNSYKSKVMRIVIFYSNGTQIYTIAKYEDKVYMSKLLGIIQL